MTRYLFIDGAFFERIFSPMVQMSFLKKVFSPLSILENSPCPMIEYFIMMPCPQKPKETESEWKSRLNKKEELFNRLNLTPNIHVRSGISRHRRERGLEQKGVDILLAIEALQHATLGNIDNACFMLSDLDFYPLFEALTQTRVKSTLYYDPHNTSKDLIYAADVAEALNPGTLNDWLRDDMRQGYIGVTSRQEQSLDAIIDRQTATTATCGGRTIIIGKERSSDYYVPHYEGSTNCFVGRLPYMVLGMFEDAPGRKVTGAERFGFP